MPIPRPMVATLAVSRKGVVSSLVLMLAILISGAIAFEYEHRTPLTTTILWVGPLLLLFMIRPLRLLMRGVAIEFTSAGLTDHTSGLGFVSWSEVVSVRRNRFWFGDYVELKLKSPDALFARLPWFRAQMWRFNLRHGVQGPAITANWVTGGADAVLAAITAAKPGETE